MNDRRCAYDYGPAGGCCGRPLGEHDPLGGVRHPFKSEIVELADRDRVTAILTLAEAATPGEWKVCDFNEGDGLGRPLWGVANDEYHNPTTSDDEPWLAIELHTGIKADAELVAALHNEAPDLLVRLLEALDTIDRLEGELSNARPWVPRDSVRGGHYNAQALNGGNESGDDR